jgi:hypothetical protein
MAAQVFGGGWKIGEGMREFRLSLSLWWGRFRTRWRRRARKLEVNHALDATVTSALIIGAVLIATSHAQDSTKLALAILLAVAEMIFVLGRLILGAIHKLAQSLSVLPDDLPSTLLHHLDGQRNDLLKRAQELSENKACDLEKHEMYATLVHLTDTVTEQKSGTLTAAIYAVSGTNIEDFQREVLAREYLAANRRAVAGQVVVRRLFLLEPGQRNSGKVAAIMRAHEAALQEQGFKHSGVRWMRKSDAGDDRDLDFALFAHEVLVRQVPRPGGTRAELTVNDAQVVPTLSAFERLWDHKDAHELSELAVSR